MKNIKEISPKYNEEEISAFRSNDEYMEAYVELLKQTLSLLFHITKECYFITEDEIPRELDRDEAIIGGNIVRLIKLNTSFLENICNRKLEICYILNRCIAECYVNLHYMLKEGEPNVLRNYVKYSLIAEKELLKIIDQNILERDDEMLEIEKRMINSVTNSFISSDFDIDEVNRSSKWKSLSERAKNVAGEQFYKIQYGLGSHAVHGNWQDILINNLEENNNKFKLNLNWNNPKPQLMSGAISFNLAITKIFSEKENLNSKKDLIRIVKILRDYYLKLSSQHEKYLKQIKKY